MMLIKALIITVLLVIFFTMASGLLYLIKDKGDGRRLVKALTWRIALSISLFLMLFVLYALGYISPHGITP